MKLNELINPASMAHDISMGLIRKQTHPSLPLVIYNYTEQAQFSRKWSKAAQLSRGLIVNSDTGDIVARPFPKFFNYDEKVKGVRQLTMDEPVIVTDKMDGSLGIMYHAESPDGYDRFAIATRGSFTSDQAVHATNLFMDKYESVFRPRHGWTYLFEIVYPENRIVVDYEGQDDLVLLGAVNIRSGLMMSPDVFSDWPGPRADIFPYTTLREAVTAPLRPGKEGFVVRSLMDHTMVKVKYEEYVQLHRIVTGLNEKEIWRRCMRAEMDPGYDYLEGIPDEFHEWVEDVSGKLRAKVRSMWVELFDAWVTAPGGLNRKSPEVRKAFALAHKDREPWLRTGLWMMYDLKSPTEFFWKQVEPRGDTKR